MVWFIIPIVLGEGTTPISAPTGVPALGEACFWGGLSRSCCSTILAARSETSKDVGFFFFKLMPVQTEYFYHF